MTRKRTKKRPVSPETPAAFRRFQKLTQALLGVSKEELDQKRTEYEQRQAATRSGETPPTGTQ
jgi:hypothetical protein